MCKGVGGGGGRGGGGGVGGGGGSDGCLFTLLSTSFRKSLFCVVLYTEKVN